MWRRKSSETLSKAGNNNKSREEEKSVKLNLWTSITQDWATGHVGLQLLFFPFSRFFKESEGIRENRNLDSGVAKINFTRFCSRFIRKTIVIKIGFSWSDFASSFLSFLLSFASRNPATEWEISFRNQMGTSVPFAFAFDPRLFTSTRVLISESICCSLEERKQSRKSIRCRTLISTRLERLFIHDRDICLILLQITKHFAHSTTRSCWCRWNRCPGGFGMRANVRLVELNLAEARGSSFNRQMIESIDLLEEFSNSDVESQLVNGLKISNSSCKVLELPSKS
jgi:hypothetical protein